MNKNYKTYEVEDFLEDKDVRDLFENRVSESQKKNWQQWLQNNIDVADKINAAKEIFATIKSEGAINSGIDTTLLWGKIEGGLDDDLSVKDSKSKTINLNLRKIYRWASAAAVFVVVGSYFVFQQMVSVNVKTSFSEKKVSVLPSGSTVNLNADTELKYSKNGWDTKRKVTLVGEAFFDVSKGVPFSIETEEGEVEVLGTSFNVYARDGILDVEVMSGIVKVAYKNKEVILKVGEKLYVENGLETIDKMTDRVDWKENNFNYSGVKLLHVASDVSRAFDLRLSIEDNIGDISFSGHVPMVDKNMALEALTWPLGLTFVIENNEVRIFKK